MVADGRKKVFSGLKLVFTDRRSRFRHFGRNKVAGVPQKNLLAIKLVAKRSQSFFIGWGLVADQ